MITLETTFAQLRDAGITAELSSKWHALVEELQHYESAAIAYSGGVDSSFLAYTTSLVLGERMLAITIQSSVEPTGQIELAANFADRMGFRQVVLPY